MIQPEFEKIFKMYAELCNYNFSDAQIRFYYNHLSHVNMSDLKSAIKFFVAERKFATVNEILHEAGYTPILSRQKKEAIEEKSRAYDRSNEAQSKDWETQRGDMTFRFTSMAATKELAHEEIQNLIEERLKKNCWEILYKVHDSETRTEVGAKKKAVIVYTQIWLARR